MKRNIFILLIVACILIVFSTFVFASETINVKDYIKGKLPTIFNIYLSSLGELDEYEKVFIDLLQNLPEEEQKNFAKEVYNNGFSKEILEKIKKEGITKPKTEIEGKNEEKAKEETGKYVSPLETKFAYIKLSDKQQLEIEYGNDIIYGGMINSSYKIGGKGEEYCLFLVDNYFKIYGDTVVKNKLVKIKEYNLKIKYASLNPDIATVNEFGKICWKDKGLAKFKISAFDFDSNAELGNTIIEIKVIKFSFVYFETSLEEVVEKLGFPDRETQTYFEWYHKYGFFEGIWYSFSSDAGCGYGITVKHWSYDKYPYLKIYVGDSKYRYVQTQGWGSGYDDSLRSLDLLDWE